MYRITVGGSSLHVYNMADEKAEEGYARVALMTAKQQNLS